MDKQKMTTRKPVQHEARLEVLKGFNIFNSAQQLLPESNVIWDEAAEKLEVKKRNLYEYVKQNRKDVKTKLLGFIQYRANTPIVISGTDVQEIDSHENREDSECELESSDDDDDDNLHSAKGCEDRMLFEENKNDIAVLHQMKSDLQFAKFFRFLGRTAFTVMYWSPEQLQFYTTVMKKIEQLEFAAIKNCMNKVNDEHYSTDEIVMYAVLGKINARIHSLAQMVSENTSNLYLFLTEWLKSGALIPSQIFCNCSHEVIPILCDAFNESMEYDKYLLKCFYFLKNSAEGNDCDYLLPKCIIRIYIRDIVSWINDLKCFQKENIKKFYIRCIIYLSGLTDHNHFIETLQSVFVLLQSQCENKYCLNYRQDLLQKFQSQIELPSQNDSCKINKYIFDLETIPQEIIKYFKNISKSVENLCSDGEQFDDIVNAYSSNEFCQILILLCSHFPLWTSLLKNEPPIIQTSLSLLYRPTNNANNINVVQFIKQNSRQIENLLRDERADMNESKISKKTKNKNVEVSYLFETENWMGLGDKNVMRYEDEDSFIDQINLTSESYDLLQINTTENEWITHSQHNSIYASNSTDDLTHNNITNLKSEDYVTTKKLDNNGDHSEALKELNSTTNNTSTLDAKDTKITKNLNKETALQINTSPKILSHNVGVNNVKRKKNSNKEVLCINNPSTPPQIQDQNVIPLNWADLSKHTFIINGNLLDPIIYNNSKIQVLKTCPLDSIFELVIWQYKKNHYYKHYFIIPFKSKMI